LHSINDPPPPPINKLLRKPYPAQTLAIMGLARRWQQAHAGAVIAECGTGKTLISLGAVQTHAEDRPFTALAMVPPQLVEKWCREAILTLPRVRVFIIDGLRTPTNSNSRHGVNEVKLFPTWRHSVCLPDRFQEVLRHSVAKSSSWHHARRLRP
jgi:predicted helicase